MKTFKDQTLEGITFTEWPLNFIDCELISCKIELNNPRDVFDGNFDLEMLDCELVNCELTGDFIADISNCNFADCVVNSGEEEPQHLSEAVQVGHSTFHDSKLQNIGLDDCHLVDCGALKTNFRECAFESCDVISGTLEACSNFEKTTVVNSNVIFIPSDLNHLNEEETFFGCTFEPDPEREWW